MTDRACVYQSADYLERLMKLAPDIRRMPAVRSAEELDGIVTRLKPFAVDMRWSILSKSLIEQCHARGIRVYSDALGPNESIDKYQQAIRDGIDVIQTDYPLQVLRALELMDAATAVQ
jgi:glycerophosphoryl diester phosphodiesterase